MATVDGVDNLTLLDFISYPVVSITRNPALDKIAAALLLKNHQTCFLCGKLNQPNSLNLSQDGSHHLSQIQVFKTYLPQDGDDRVETCASCFQDIKQVWDLTQQMKAIQQDIDQIVQRVLQLRNEENKMIPRNESQEAERSVPDNDCNTNSLPDVLEGSFCDTVIVEVKDEIPFDEDPETGNILFGNLSIEDEKMFGEERGPEPESSISIPIPQKSLNSVKSQTGSKRKKGKLIRDPLAFTDSENVVLEFNTSTKSRDKTSNPTKAKCPCPHCGKVLNLSSLRKHVRHTHQGVRPHGCSFCGKSFTSKKNLADHVGWNHTRETYSCSKCSKKIASRRQWAIHEASICRVTGWGVERLKTEFNITLVTCPVEGCGRLYDSIRRRDINNHLVSRHSNLPVSLTTESILGLGTTPV